MCSTSISIGLRLHREVARITESNLLYAQHHGDIFDSLVVTCSTCEGGLSSSNGRFTVEIKTVEMMTIAFTLCLIDMCFRPFRLETVDLT